MFAVAAIPLMALAGASLDYSTASRIKTKLDASADAAALGVVSHAAMSMDAASAQIAAQNIFNAQAGTVNGITISNVSATVTDSGLNRSASISYAASVPTMFMKILGANSVTVNGQSTAVSGMSTYIDFYLLLDNSPSMGVGATPGDVAAMVNHTPDQCAFACHDLSNSNSYYNLAKQLGVTMRIDVLRTATQQLMDTAQTIETSPDQYRVALYTFGSSATNLNLTTIASLTSDLASTKSAAAGIDLMTVPYQNYNNDQDTSYDTLFPAINAVIPNPGPGTATAPQKVLFFVSDGVADENLNGSRTISPINVSLCNSIKARGVLIAVLYTTYLPLPTNSYYNQHVAPFVNDIGPTMQSCASPGLYFEVSPTQGISDAMATLFQKAVMSAHLTH